mmetsp:Transcript_81651/g.170856  ORF Transcript_81651/g.170856 Transcript_81651/m.170856 type:complete len:229 (+) Transcript_81651:1081-1767(+)
MARAKAPSLLFVGSLPHDMLAGERECLFSRHLLLLLLLLVVVIPLLALPLAVLLVLAFLSLLPLRPSFRSGFSSEIDSNVPVFEDRNSSGCLSGNFFSKLHVGLSLFCIRCDLHHLPKVAEVSVQQREVVQLLRDIGKNESIGVKPGKLWLFLSVPAVVVCAATIPIAIAVSKLSVWLLPFALALFRLGRTVKGSGRWDRCPLSLSLLRIAIRIIITHFLFRHASWRR